MASNSISKSETTWEAIFEKAVSKLGKTELYAIVQAWANCYSRVTKSDIVKLNPILTQQHCAELLWWKALFPNEALPGVPEWFSDKNFQQLANVIEATANDDLNPLFPGRSNYTSMLEFIMLKAGQDGIPISEAEQQWTTSFDWAPTEFPDESHQYWKFRAELQMWRVLFPSERFPGRNPATGIYHLRSQEEITCERDDLEGGNSKNNHLTIELIEPDINTNNSRSATAAGNASRAPLRLGNPNQEPTQNPNQHKELFETTQPHHRRAPSSYAATPTPRSEAQSRSHSLSQSHQRPTYARRDRSRSLTPPPFAYRRNVNDINFRERSPLRRREQSPSFRGRDVSPGISYSDAPRTPRGHRFSPPRGEFGFGSGERGRARGRARRGYRGRL